MAANIACRTPAGAGASGLKKSGIPCRAVSVSLKREPLAREMFRRYASTWRHRLDPSCILAHACAAITVPAELHGQGVNGPVVEDAVLAAPEKSKALVLGAGITGLTLAAAISQHFDEVHILERESLNGMEGNRRGVPQYRHPHQLSRGGALILEKYVPGFEQDCVAAGAIVWDALENVLNYDLGGYRALPPAEEQSGHCRLIGGSRMLLEGVLRRRVFEKPNVILRPSSVVTGLAFTPDGSRVTGVRLKDGSELSGDLVVDASGRGSKLRDWLGEAGVKGLVPPEIVDSGLQYSSRNYRLPANWPKEKLCLLSRSKGDGRHCIVLPMEHEQWQVILAGRKPHLPPADEEGFLQWIKDLPTSDTYDALTAATPTSPVFVYTSTQNIHRHLENVEMPDGLVAVGDAACSFNPIYGQGMTAAVQGADLLAQSIGSRLEAAQTSSSTTSRQEILKGLSQEFQTKLTATVEFPWKVATGNDIKFLQAQGLLPTDTVSLKARLMEWYMERAVRSAAEFWRSNLRITQVMHMVQPSSALFHPEMVLRVLLLVVREFLAGGVAKEQNDTETARSRPEVTGNTSAGFSKSQ